MDGKEIDYREKFEKLATSERSETEETEKTLTPAEIEEKRQEEIEYTVRGIYRYVEEAREDRKLMLQHIELLLQNKDIQDQLHRWGEITADDLITCHNRINGEKPAEQQQEHTTDGKESGYRETFEKLGICKGEIVAIITSSRDDRFVLDEKYLLEDYQTSEAFHAALPGDEELKHSMDVNQQARAAIQDYKIRHGIPLDTPPVSETPPPRSSNAANDENYGPAPSF